MKTIPAIYENGIFRPEEPVALEDGTRVEILVPQTVSLTREEMKERFPKSWGVLTADEADRIAQAIEEACGQIDSDEKAARSP